MDISAKLGSLACAKTLSKCAVITVVEYSLGISPQLDHLKVVGIVRQLLTVLLAILIVNPVCCCAFGAFLTGAKQADTSIAKCCAKKQQHFPTDPGHEKPDERPECPCDRDVAALTEAKVNDLAPVWNGDLVAELEFAPDAPLQYPTRLVDIAQPVISEALPPGPSWRMYCSYLL